MLALLFTNCNSGTKTKKHSTVDSSKITVATNDSSGTIMKPPTLPDSVIITMRKNYFRISSITDWTNVVNIELDESTEGGEAAYYYKHDTLEKIEVKLYGEISQTLEEYYFMNNLLSYVYERELIYNRPIYYDSAKMKEEQDSVTFDITKSDTIETKSFFRNGKLGYQVCNMNEEKGYFTDFSEKRIINRQKELLAKIPQN